MPKVELLPFLTRETSDRVIAARKRAAARAAAKRRATDKLWQATEDLILRGHVDARVDAILQGRDPGPIPPPHLAGTDGLKQASTTVVADAADQPPARTKPYRSKDEAVVTHLKAQFLKALAATASTTKACVAISRTRGTVFRWRDQDAAFAKAWDEVFETRVDDLEDSLLKRATHGFKQPVFQQGSCVGYQTIHHPQLGMFMLSRLRRAKYADDHSAGALPPSQYAEAVRNAFAAQDAAAQAALQGRTPSPASPSPTEAKGGAA